jgi:hypothetical protein
VKNISVSPLWVVASVLICLLAGAQPAPQAGTRAASQVNPQVGPQVGWIDHFEGSAGYYALVRNGRNIGIECCWTPLYAGDSIVVHYESARVFLNFGGDRDVRVCHKKNSSADCDEESPYVIKGHGNTGAIRYLMQWAADYLTGWFSTHPLPAPGEQDAVARGAASPLTVPLLDFEEGHVLAGSRKLQLAWHGGAPPYRLEIRREGGKDPVLRLESVSITRTSIPGFILNEGSYSFDIADAQNQRVAKRFKVVADSELPAIPADLAKADIPNDMKETLAAAWLSSQSHGLWAWEAYLETADIADSYAPATVLRDALERGKTPAELLH